MNVTRGLAGVNDTHLYYEATGQGSPLVLIHESTRDARMWDDQFEALARRHRVVRYDVRGFGRSARLTGSSFLHAEDLRALLAFLGVSEAHLLGLSMGARIALAHALHYPGATLSVILTSARADLAQLQRLSEIRIPALILVGERDLPDVQDVSERLARGIQNARKVVLKGVGHLCNLEDAPAFNAIVTSFLDLAEAAREGTSRR